MKNIKKFSQDYIYIFSTLVVLFAITLLYLFNTWLSKDGRLNYDIYGILTYFVPFAFAFGMFYLIGNINKIKFNKDKIGIGFLLGWPAIVVGLYNFIPALTVLDKTMLLERICYYTLIMLFIGIFEEVLCRGIILSNMLDKWGNSKKGVIKAVIISSFIFGVGHIVNLLIYPTFVIRTISQILTASLHGMLYTSVYLRTKNLWAVILLHAVYDWFVKFSSIFHSADSGITPADISIVDLIINVAYALPWALIALFYLRKVWVNKSSLSSIDEKAA